jgi:hypothetical protein
MALRPSGWLVPLLLEGRANQLASRSVNIFIPFYEAVINFLNGLANCQLIQPWRAVLSRLACPLNGAVLMQVHEPAQAAPGLVREGIKKVRKHMQNHAPCECMA